MCFLVQMDLCSDHNTFDLGQEWDLFLTWMNNILCFFPLKSDSWSKIKTKKHIFKIKSATCSYYDYLNLHNFFCWIYLVHKNKQKQNKQNSRSLKLASLEITDKHVNVIFFFQLYLVQYKNMTC